VYASVSCQKKLRPVSAAAEKMARILRLGFDVKLISKRFSPIYVYYEVCGDDPIPIYCGYNQSSAKEVYASLRNMMFVLSFHPKHEALKPIRKSIIHSS
jgi:hypothetical protein